MKILRPNFKKTTKPKMYRLQDLKDGECFMYYHTREGIYIKGFTSNEEITATNVVTGETSAEVGYQEVLKIRTLVISNVEEEGI